uniref:Phosphofructokinase domain-containing protein n=1 Tax=Pyrodinium bahamense TaxID=73915 RepID=A0A7S0FQJ3_9DINO
MARFKSKELPLTIKYIDPTYTVRSCKANAYDSVYCSDLAGHAVHGAMAGLTGISVVKVYGRYVYMPLQAILRATAQHKCLNPKGRWFARMLFTTRQPGFEPDGFEYPPTPDSGMRDKSTALSFAEVLLEGTEVRRLLCANLGDTFPTRAVNTSLQYNERAFVQANSWSTQTLQRQSGAETQGRSYLQLLRCGPRATLHFEPAECAAAIVTCGGLCPGLNSVVRELSRMLLAYGVPTVYGIRGGYNGCSKEEDWINLTQDTVQDIHTQGGSILVSDRGNPPVSEIAEVMKRRNIRQFFVLGGDGTHKGAMATFKEMAAIGHECAVVGVPKTIDNDIQLLDRSFGFQTACTEAEKAIYSAYVESTTNANCIGLVKLMGRHCGWIAAYATLALRNVDVCLIPEMNISLPKLLEYVASVMRRKRCGVVVVAEGCGDTIIEASGEVDAGGNKKLADVGLYLKDEITRHCKGQGIPITIKYIDPTYMIRSVPANAFDSQYCAALAQEAVHAAMAGYTGISVGMVDGRYVMLPIHAITEHGPRKVDLGSRVFERLMATTAQPNLEP